MSYPRDSCQCRIVPITRGGVAFSGVTIEYCPMHDAAPDLLDALKRVEFILVNRMRQLPDPKAMLRFIGSVIAKAESTAPGRAEQSQDPSQSTEAK